MTTIFAKVRLWPGELIWVEVDGQYPDGRFHGTLANDPVNSPVECGASVSFGEAQVYDVMLGGVQ